MEINYIPKIKIENMIWLYKTQIRLKIFILFCISITEKYDHVNYIRIENMRNIIVVRLLIQSKLLRTNQVNCFLFCAGVRNNSRVTI